MNAAIGALVVPRELRRRVAAFAGLALIVAIGAGVAIGALVAADRTDRAYPDYVRDAEVVDLAINPSLTTRAVATAIRHFPGVRSTHTDALFEATVTHTRAGPVGRVFSADKSLQVRGSTDGRYEAVDRPVVTDGRFASGKREVFVAEDYRPELEATVRRHLRVGDTIEVAFWWGLVQDAGLSPDTVVQPIGVERLRIAGFGRLPDEMLPDELYPRQRLIVSADVARRYACSSDVTADMTLNEAEAAVFPPDCARSYEYYALRLKDGRRSKVAVRRAFTQATDRLAKDVPQAVKDVGVSYVYVSQDRGDVDGAVRQVTRPTIAALGVFGVVAGIATLTVVALAISRIFRRNDAQQWSLHALGATRGQRALIGAGPPLAAVLAGVIGAVPVALATSVVGPAGSVRAVTPSAGFALPARVVVPAVGAIGIALVIVTLALAWTAAKRASTTLTLPLRRPWLTGVLAHSSRPAATEGVRAALSTRRSDGSAAVLAGCVVALAAVVAAVVFATNLSALVREPVRYGWPWDAAVITDGGYGNTDPGKVAASLDGSAEVKDYAYFALDAGSPMAGHPVPTIYGFRGAGRMTLPLVAGGQARRSGDAVLGARTAAELGVSIGDRVPIDSPAPRLHVVRVVGIGVLPSLGQIFADRSGLGTGAFVQTDVDPADPGNLYPAVTGIRLRAGTDAKAFLAGVRPKAKTWDIYGGRPYTYTSAVRPSEIVNADDMRAAPLLLGGLLALGLTIGLALSIGVSVRDRRRELAILRALGFSTRNLRATVGWQAMATVAVGLVAGIPVGIVAGRLAWRTFADQLGVVAHANVPVGWLALVAIVAVVLGLVAAAPSAHTVTRTAPSDLFNDVS